MPYKTCPNCGVEHGPRRLACECGYSFKSPVEAPAKGFPYPEPGSWIYDRPKGHPPLSKPVDLPEGQLDNEIIKDCISYEGAGFCIYTYIRVDRIEDAKLRKLWQEARDAMQRIVEYLE